MKSGKIIIRVLVVLLVFCLLFYVLQRLLVPKYMTEAEEGRLIAEYYDSEKIHDVIFIGDCEVYENISPVALWKNYGISSYVRGSPQQLIWHSYYLLEDTLKYEIPEVVVFNVLSMKYGEPQSEAYNRLALDGMRLSSSKINAIKASMCEDESFLSYIFPLLRFHSRWSELESEDFEYWFKDTPALSVAGYLMRVDVKGTDFFPEGQPLKDYSFADVCWEYLDKMRILCEENGIKFVLMKAPSISPYWYDEWEEQIEEYAAKYNLQYYNFLELTEEIGIDYTKDTYDAGQHLNLSGAEKLSVYFGNILKGFVTDRSCDTDYCTVWKELEERYLRIKEAQEKILAEEGKFSGFPTVE